MTLEDFFTLSELNNGLTTPSRVTELVAIMEKEADSFGKNVVDVTRQWSTVAGAISATDNKDCLDLFVQLHGLDCIAKWLKHAQKLVGEESDRSIEETIAHLLRAVEAFNVDHGKLISSEIWTTVRDLVVHNIPSVQSRARVLFEKWENNAATNLSPSDNEKSGALIDNQEGEIQDVKRGSEHAVESSLGVTHPSQATSTEEKVNESTRDETSNTNDVEDAGDGFVNNSGDKFEPIEPEKLSDHAKYSSLPKSTLAQPHPTGATPGESCAPSVLNNESSVAELPSLEELKLHEGTSEGSHIGLKAIDSDGKNPIDGSGDAKECDGQSVFRKSSSDNRLGIRKEFRPFNMGIEADGKVNRRDLLTSGCDLANSYGLGKKHTDREVAAKNGRRSDNETDYGIVDPLEVARQVAIEVEREVVDYRGQSCNSSEKSPENNIREPDSPESVRGEKNQVRDDDSPDETRSYADVSDEDSKMQEESSSESADAEQRNETQDMTISPPVIEAAKTEINAEKVMCDFDLNQVSSEDAEDHASPVSTPVSMVSASRATAAPGLPFSPLQFEGNLGWKGSAATSAFRPASPRRIPESEKEFLAGESSKSKKTEAFLDFDLNVAETLDPRESSPDANSRKSEHLALDLNNIGESGSGGPQDRLFGKFFTHQSASNSSSSSKQPISFIDLNDQPSFLNNSDISDFSRLQPQTFDAFDVSKPKETAFSIFGAKVEIDPKDSVPQTISLSNGQTPELAFNATNMGQARSFFGIAPMVQYANSSVYGYNNIQPGPSMSLSPAVYGSGGPVVPYMVDSRGAPVIPQIVGSASAFQNHFPQPPFVMNPSSSNHPSNGAGPSRSGFDLNSGSIAESSSRDTSSFGPFLNLGQLRSMDEQLRTNSQPAVGSVVGQKRKEPENGWENYGLRPYTPPWK